MNEFSKMVLASVIVGVFTMMTPAAWASHGLVVTENTDVTENSTGGNGDSGLDGDPGEDGGFPGDGISFDTTEISVTNSATATGGNGGNGGNGTLSTSAGGIGAWGGAGVSVYDYNTFTNLETGVVVGGNGGDAGTSGVDAVSGGDGGNGGNGISVGYSSSVYNYGSVTGGNGGDASFASVDSGDGGHGVGIYSDYAYLYNEGTIQGGSHGALNTENEEDGAGVYVSEYTYDSYVENQGTIAAASEGGVAIQNDGEYSIVYNGEDGVIEGDIVGNYQSQGLENYGTINGDVDLGDATEGNYIENAGTINGNIYSGADDDYFATYGGVITGDIDLGDGENEVIIGEGEEEIEVLVLEEEEEEEESDPAVITGNITTGSDDDDLEFYEGTVNGDIDLGDGENEIYIGSDEEEEYELFALEEETEAEPTAILNGNLYAGADDDDLEIDVGAEINGDIDLGDGDNDIDIYGGEITGNIYTGEDEDDLYFYEGTVTGDIDVGDDYNYIEIGETSYSCFSCFSLEEEETELTAILNGNLYGGSDDDYLYVYDTAQINGDIDLGDGYNDIYLYGGEINGNLTTGYDEDELYFYGGQVNGDIYLGSDYNYVYNYTDYTTGGTVSAGDSGAISFYNYGAFTAEHDVTLDDDDGYEGYFYNDGTFTLAGGDLWTTGDIDNYGNLVIGAGDTATAQEAYGYGTYTFEIAGSEDYGQMILTSGTIDLSSGAVQAIFAAVSSGLADGDELLIVDGTVDVTGGPGSTPVALDEDSFLWDLNLVGGTGIGEPTDDSELYILVSQTNALDDILGETGGTLGDILEDLMDEGTEDPELLELFGALNGAESEEEVQEIIESILPTLDGGGILGALDITQSVLNTTDDQLASLRRGDATGIAAGNEGDQGYRMWAQPFGQKSEQDERGGVAGYEANTHGIAFGWDNGDGENGTLGLAVSYGSTDVDSNNVTNTDTEVDSYQLTVYGLENIDEQTFIEGMLAYAFSEIKSIRYDVGGFGSNAYGDYDANQYLARFRIGREYEHGSATVVTPSLFADYTHFDPEGYTETGAGGLNLTVEGDSVDILDLGFDVAAEKVYEKADGAKLAPRIHAGYRYDVIGDDFSATSRFTGGGGSFTTNGLDPARGTFNAGLGYAYESGKNWDINAAYDYEAKSDYDSHSVLLRCRRKF